MRRNPGGRECDNPSRRQNGRKSTSPESPGKKDKARVDGPALKRVHGLGRFDGRNRPAHDPPLDDVSHHEQIEEDKRRRAPAAGF